MCVIMCVILRRGETPSSLWSRLRSSVSRRLAFPRLLFPEIPFSQHRPRNLWLRIREANISPLLNGLNQTTRLHLHSLPLWSESTEPLAISTTPVNPSGSQTAWICGKCVWSYSKTEVTTDCYQQLDELNTKNLKKSVKRSNNFIT